MKKMLKKYRAGDLEAYTDVNGQLASDFGIFTSPNTVLVNKDGKEIGRPARFRGMGQRRGCRISLQNKGRT